VTGKRQVEDGGTTYLHVMAHHDGHRPRCNVFQISDMSPRNAMAGSIDSCEQAQRLALRRKRSLRISRQAWEQMRDAGVAPEHTPDGITIA
jgi:hypothetical protein